MASAVVVTNACGARALNRTAPHAPAWSSLAREPGALKMLTRFRQGELDVWLVWRPYAPTPARSTYRGQSIADLYRQRFGQALDQNRADSFDPDVLETLYPHILERSILPIDEPTLRSLQHQADVLHELGLMAARVAVRDGTYSLQTRQNWTY